mgnify:CR=1 FL=1
MSSFNFYRSQGSSDECDLSLPLPNVEGLNHLMNMQVEPNDTMCLNSKTTPPTSTDLQLDENIGPPLFDPDEFPEDDIPLPENDVPELPTTFEVNVESPTLNTTNFAIIPLKQGLNSLHELTQKIQIQRKKINLYHSVS